MLQNNGLPVGITTSCDETKKRVVRQWLPEHDKILIENWRVISSRAIANMIFKGTGETFSRLAVIGRAHRLKLKCDFTVKAPEAVKARAEVKAVGPKAPKKKLRPIIADPSPLMTSMGDLGHTSCRWPYGDPKKPESFGFCGHDTGHPSAPYCHFHMQKRSQKTKYPLRHSKDMDVGYV